MFRLGQGFEGGGQMFIDVLWAAIVLVGIAVTTGVAILVVR